MSEQQFPKFINPFTDFGFKKIFGEEANKDLLINFLNELLKYQNQQIKDLVYKKTERLGLTGLDRNVIFDLFCENEKGEKFTVELQKAKQSFFKDRMVYYSSFSVREQGEKDKWNYKLKAVYVIAILDFIIDENNKEEIVVSHNKLIDTERHTVFYDKLTFITLQMPNFNKSAEELETNFDKWLYVIKNLKNLERIPEKLQEKIFQKLFSVASLAALSKTERAKYEDSIKYYNDLKNSIDTAFDEGIIEGKAEGKVEGKAEAYNELKSIIEQEQQKAEQERQKAERKNMALINSVKIMKQAGIVIEEIQKATGLSLDIIEKI